MMDAGVGETAAAEGAKTAGEATAAGATADAGATAGVAGGTAAAGAGTTAGATYGAETAAALGTGGSATAGGTLLGQVGTSVLTAGATSVATSLLNPKPKANTPTLAAPIGMPDPLAQQQAIKQSMIEQMARRGRASTIMTEAADSGGKLGG